MEFAGFEVAVGGRRGELVFNRPDQLNPLSTDTLIDMERAARWFDDQRDLQVVVVRGEGRAFCVGADLKSFTPGGMVGHDPHIAGDAGRRMADALEAMRAVTIAQLHGHCVGGGLVVAAACDLRIASTNTRFSIPEVDLGIPLAWGGINRLVREIGPALTKELVMTCRPFDAQEALTAGFLNRVVAEDELTRTVDELTEQICGKPAFAVQTTKSAVNQVTSHMVGMAGSWRDAEALMAGLNDPEGQAAAAAYLNRHKS